MKQRNLESLVSGKIARTKPFEGGAASEAWENGTTIMANTWGHYVSSLAEMLPEGTSLDTLLTKLCISREEFMDPSVHFGMNRKMSFTSMKGAFKK